MAASRSRFVAVTPGDPAGVGPEVAWKSLQAGDGPFLCVGARAAFTRLGARVIETGLEALGKGATPPASHTPYVWLLPAPARAPLGRLLEGYQSGWSIETATRLVLEGTASAIVTGPISKERLNAGGYLYPGHTEFLAKLCRARSVTMMLANERLRVSLATTHVALSRVSSQITRAHIRRAVSQTIEGLRALWGKRVPRVAVLGLNPHAGEAGLFGKEEARVIAPEIRSMQAKARGRYAVEGPFPADTFFALHARRFDAVVAMYHDQGLIPVKQLDFSNTVNITLGLPIVRTSVDHGVAFDIAGTGMADPSSFRAALRLAQRFARARRSSR